MPAPSAELAKPSGELVYGKVPDGFVPLEKLTPAKVYRGFAERIRASDL
jgi:hypothetical protein